MPNVQPMQALHRIRRRTWAILEVGARGDSLSRTVDLLILALVFGNVVAVIASSIPSIDAEHQTLFIGFERLSLAIFSSEFLLRLWSVASAETMGATPTQRRLNYLRSPMAIVDLLAIAPFYLSAFVDMDLRMLRILRLLRIVKLTRYSAALHRLWEVYHLQRATLTASFMVMSVAIILSASAVYVAEHEAQPTAFASIPHAMWWAICTLTTVGYGDVTPVTNLGKVLAAGIQLVGIAIVAIPTSLFASGFAHIMTRNEHRLEQEAREAAADGVVTQAEAHHYSDLAAQLGVEPEIAEEIILAAQKRQVLADFGSCPHCGKSVD